MANGRVREYIGARYVPIFADPVTWDDERAYDPLTMVQYSGETYMSKQYVPIGAPLPTVAQGEESNDFWVHMSNWNAQVEGYREEVMRYAEEVLLFDGRIDTLEADLPTTEFDSTNTVKAAIDAINTAITAIQANGWVTTDRIADSAVTSAKIADGTIATGDIADSAITSAKIADGTIATGDIADSAITSAKIADGTIVNADIADGTIKKAKLANDDIFLIFGDSWTNFTDHPNWSTDVNKILGCGSIMNYGVGGAKFTGATNLISTQITTAINQMTETQKNNVKYVIIMAGVNDMSPWAPAGFDLAVITAMQMCKNNFQNAVVQWFPTSCAPSYGNENGPKWLVCNAAFWWTVGRYGSTSDPGDRDGTFCFPSCGTLFYMNSDTAPDAFFNSDGLHLNDYGRRAVGNAVLDGFGKLNMVYSRTKSFERGSGKFVNITYTPNTLQCSGHCQSTGNTALGNAGVVMLGVLAAINSSALYNNNKIESFWLIGFGSPGGSATPTYVTIDATNSWTGAIFTTAGSYTADSMLYLSL